MRTFGSAAVPGLGASARPLLALAGSDSLSGLERVDIGVVDRVLAVCAPAAVESQAGLPGVAAVDHDTQEFRHAEGNLPFDLDQANVRHLRPPTRALGELAGSGGIFALYCLYCWAVVRVLEVRGTVGYCVPEATRRC